jgi:hypothetical protein
MAEIIGRTPFFDRSGMRKLERERERERERRFREAGWYPEMVWFFRKKFNPRKETVREFIERQKPSHERFLRKRGWDDESIDLLWTEMMVNLAHKYANFKEAVEALRRAETRGRKFRIGGRYYAT